MSDSDDPVTKRLIDIIADPTTEEKELSTHVKTLKTYEEAKKLMEPEPIPVPEPTGFKAFLDRHADALIKVGGTLAAVIAIAGIEAKGDIIFRSKATKYL